MSNSKGKTKHRINLAGSDVEFVLPECRFCGGALRVDGVRIEIELRESFLIACESCKESTVRTGPIGSFANLVQQSIMLWEQEEEAETIDSFMISEFLDVDRLRKIATDEAKALDSDVDVVIRALIKRRSFYFEKMYTRTPSLTVVYEHRAKAINRALSELMKWFPSPDTKDGSEK